MVPRGVFNQYLFSISYLVARLRSDGPSQLKSITIMHIINHLRRYSPGCLESLPYPHVAQLVVGRCEKLSKIFILSKAGDLYISVHH